jgi:hypothetical protein
MRINATKRRAAARIATLTIAAATCALAWAPTQAQAGETDTMTVEGYIWQDDNADGVMGDDEESVPGLELSLAPCPTDGECTATTDADGHYEIGFLPPSEGPVQVAVPLDQGGTPWGMSDANTDFTREPAGDSAAGMALSTELELVGASTTSRNLGVYREGTPTDGSNAKPDNPDQPNKPGDENDSDLPTIKGFVWDDTDHDGIQDKGEKGLAGREVRLEHESDMKCQENPDCTAKTDSEGNYTIHATGGGSGRITLSTDIADNDQTDATLGISPKGKGKDRSLDSDVTEGDLNGPHRAQAVSDEISFSEGKTTEVDAGLFKGDGSGAGGSESHKGGLPVTGVGLTAVIAASAALLIGGIVLAMMARRRKRAAAAGDVTQVL